MSISSIFAKFDEVERKLNELSSRSPTAGVVTDGGSGDFVKRIEAVEAALSLFQQHYQNQRSDAVDLDPVLSRLSVLESVTQMPTELPQRVENIENVLNHMQMVMNGAASDIQTLNQKLNHLETVTLPHIVSRLENLEQRNVE